MFELEHPALIRAYALRPANGGSGRHRGGRGVVREYEALEAIDVSLITERRRRSPRGIAGGSDGSPGHNSLNGKALPGRAELRMSSGDVLRIETPGGGGWGTL